MTTSIWKIELLGPFCVRRDELVYTRFRTHKTGAMLAYLAAYPDRSVRREELIDLFWPDNDLDSGRNCLRIALSALRRVFHPDDNEDPRTPAVVLADREHVRLNPITYTTDKAEFEASLLKAMRSEEGPVRAEWIKKALAIYQSDLLPGYDEPWITGERARLADARLLAIRRLVALLVKLQDVPAALDYAHRAVELDPLREESQRMLIQLYTAMGQQDAALRQYHHLEHLLHEQLGSRPSSKTRILAAQLNAEIYPSANSGGGVATLVSNSMSSSSVPPPRPISGLSPHVGRLPIPYTPFFGHENSIAQVVEMLETPDTRLVTLTGLGGNGKSRLALAVGEHMRDALDEPVWFVPLAQVSDPRHILDAIARTMALPRQCQLPLLDQIAQAVGNLPALLILDNFEHLISKANTAVQDLLETIPGLRCLVTSRQRLNVAGEYEYAIEPLPTPQTTGTPERLMEFASVQLFVNRAQAVRSNFQITRENAAAIAGLCHHLEGVPLAIELAAAYVQVLTPAQIRTRLTQRLSLLVNRNKDVPDRHSSLRAALDWSFRLLEPSLQRFFARLSTMRGGWTIEAAEEICKDLPTSGEDEDGSSVNSTVPHSKAKQKSAVNGRSSAISLLPLAFLRAPDILQNLIELRERSLIQADDSTGEMRYSMLETVREYAEEQLLVFDTHMTDWRHSLFFMRLAEQAEPHLTGLDTVQWLNRLQLENYNLRAALRFLTTSTPSNIPPSQMEAEEDTSYASLRLAASIWRFWCVRGYYEEGQDWLSKALEQHTSAPATYKMKALRGLANLAYECGEAERAQKAFEELKLLAEAAQDEVNVAAALFGLGNVAKMRGDLALSRTLREQSLDLFRQLGDRRGIALTLANLANVINDQGDAAQAKQHLLESLAIFRELGDTPNIVTGLNNLTHTLLELGETASAYTYLLESLTLACALENKYGFVHALINIASLCESQRRPQQATRLLGSAAACISQMMIPQTHRLSQNVEKQRIRLSTILGEREFEDNWNYGLALSFDQALQLAREPLPGLN